MRFRFPIQILSTLTCLLTLVPLSASAQTAADLFDRDAVQEIRLFINSRDLDQLRTKFREDVYYVVDFQWRNLRVRNAAVRSRGGVSRNPSKPALRIDFNRYTTGQRFVGLKSLVLDNLWQQPSFVAESTDDGVLRSNRAAGTASVLLQAVHQQRLPWRLYDHRSGRHRLSRADAW